MHIFLLLYGCNPLVWYHSYKGVLTQMGRWLSPLSIHIQIWSFLDNISHNPISPPCTSPLVYWLDQTFALLEGRRELLVLFSNLLRWITCYDYFYDVGVVGWIHPTRYGSTVGHTFHENISNRNIEKVEICVSIYFLISLEGSYWTVEKKTKKNIIF